MGHELPILAVHLVKLHWCTGVRKSDSCKFVNDVVANRVQRIASTGGDPRPDLPCLASQGRYECVWLRHEEPTSREQERRALLVPAAPAGRPNANSTVCNCCLTRSDAKES